MLQENPGVYVVNAGANALDLARNVIDMELPLNARARRELTAEAFGGKGYHVTTPSELRSALAAAIVANGPSIIDCELDPAAGVESGHLAGLNPTSAATPRPAVSADA